MSKSGTAEKKVPSTMLKSKLELDERILLRDGKPIKADREEIEGLDPGIRNLVRVLEVMGFEKVFSCEGHLLSSYEPVAKQPFPWINIQDYYSSDDNVRKLEELVDAFNITSKIKWFAGKLHPGLGSVRVREEAKNFEELGRMQKSAEELALFLYNNQDTAILWRPRKTDPFH
jgi:hypothetical protein